MSTVIQKRVMWKNLPSQNCSVLEPSKTEAPKTPWQKNIK